jgi:hypothetical protein
MTRRDAGGLARWRCPVLMLVGGSARFTRPWSADGFEGTVAKRTTARYRCGKRSNAWVKLKSPASRDRDRRRFLASLAA